MILVYSAQARADLAAVADYLNPRNPSAAQRVGQAIRTIIEDLPQHPMRGRRQDSPEVRKAVEPRYGYLIYYHLDEPTASVTILSVQHHALARRFEDI